MPSRPSGLIAGFLAGGVAGFALAAGLIRAPLPAQTALAPACTGEGRVAPAVAITAGDAGAPAGPAADPGFTLLGTLVSSPPVPARAWLQAEDSEVAHLYQVGDGLPGGYRLQEIHAGRIVVSDGRRSFDVRPSIGTTDGPDCPPATPAEPPARRFGRQAAAGDDPPRHRSVQPRPFEPRPRREGPPRTRPLEGAEEVSPEGDTGEAPATEDDPS